MSFAKLIVIQPGHPTREVLLDSGVVTIGRALDNSISLEGDSNVSRYHAEIEKRIDGFWIADLGSSNGTTVNDLSVDFDQLLSNGDLIGVGGSTIVEFHLSDVPWVNQQQPREQVPQEAPVENRVQELPAVAPQTPTSVDASVQIPEVPVVTPASTGLSPMLLIGAIGGGLLLTGVVAAVFFYARSGGCKATVRIVSPQTGATIKGPVSIRVEAEDTECVDRVIYQLDGVKVASSEIAPYQAMLDPADLSGLTPGNHVLTVTVEDEEGNRKVQPDEVVLGFETAQVFSTDTNPPTGSDNGPTGQTNQQASQNLSAACARNSHERLQGKRVISSTAISSIKSKSEPASMLSQVSITGRALFEMLSMIHLLMSRDSIRRSATWWQ
jgi:pSer/pThr/pTyr-binding forkhead associated (FHA) protein